MFRQRAVCFPRDRSGHNTSPEAHSNFLSVVVCQLVPSVMPFVEFGAPPARSLS